MGMCSKEASNGSMLKRDDNADMSRFCFSNHHPKRL